MSSEQRSYYRRRAREERELAAASVDERVHGIHLELAIRYELLSEDRPASPTGDQPD